MVETPKWPELARGHKGTNVKALQLLLRYRGANISVDGDFGTNTYNAVLNFQKNNGLHYKDGVAGEETLSAMIVTIKSRTINDAAWAAQTLLNKFENLTVDSDFWTGSEKATRDFQTKMGFTASNITGTVTPITWRYLFGYDAYPSGGGITPGNDGNIQGNKDYRGQSILTDSQIALLNANKRFYQSAAATYGIPWQMIAAIHYRENSLLKSGPSNGHGPYQIWKYSYQVGAYTDEQFQDATNSAAQFIKEKLGSRSCTSADNVKYGFFAYNGISSAYKNQATKLGFTSDQANNGEGSPYVMNRYDKMRDPTVEPTKSNNTWGQIKVDGGPIVYPANQDYGAYVVYCSLL